MTNPLNTDESEPDIPNIDTLKGRMWADLLTAELYAKAAHHDVTRRAEIYVHAAGLPLEQVLDALKCSRATWYRRVEALRAREAENLAISRSRDARSRDAND